MVLTINEYLIYANNHFTMILKMVKRQKIPFQYGERGGSVVECRTLEREVGVRNLLLPCCVLEQDTLLPESTG